MQDHCPSVLYLRPRVDWVTVFVNAKISGERMDYTVHSKSLRQYESRIVDYLALKKKSTVLVCSQSLCQDIFINFAILAGTLSYISACARLRFNEFHSVYTVYRNEQSLLFRLHD